LFAIAAFTDISEQKAAEQDLRTANTQLEKRQKEIEDDLILAARVQQSLAPKSLVWGGMRVETFYHPVRTIGGDFGLVSPLDEDHLNVLVGDVSGHGISSALIANRIYSETLHELEHKTKPGTLLRHLHDFVHDHIGSEGFYFTMAAARFARRGRHMIFAAAGHPPAMLISKGGLRLLDSQNGILGWLPDTAPTESVNEIELAPGDRLVFYTDGLVEVFNSLDDMLGVEGLAALVRQSAERTLGEMKQAILDGVTAWRLGPVADDVSLVIVEVR